MTNMQIQVLFFGDVFGHPGRFAVAKAIKHFQKQRKIDFVIVNGENAAHGRGITPEMAEAFFDQGVDVITLGNHAWDQKTLIPYFAQTQRLIRPLNYPDSAAYKTPGKGSVVLETKSSQVKIGVLQVMGRVFMDPLDCPFVSASQEVQKMHQQGVQCIIVDFHGEATSEKQAFSYYLDGKVSAVLGTHSHVQTSDERILPQKTAAITDVGMCGCFDSVIGAKKELVIEKFLTKRPLKLEPAEGVAGFSAVIVSIEVSSGAAVSIERFFVRNVELL
jgi:metallophosphoesterase (TIGR00282 family)